jgi:hypothetical protein
VSQKERREHRDLGSKLFRETAPTEGVEPELKPRHSVGVDQRLAAHKSEQKTTFQATAVTSIQDPDPLGYVCFWASWISIRFQNLFVRIQIWILPSTG